MSKNSFSHTPLKQFESASVQLSSEKSIEDRISQLKILEEEWNSKCNLMEENANKAKSSVKLDVGGKIFKISKETLLSKKDTFFYAMISSGKWLPDDDGSYFIDRNPKLFSYILDYMRYGKVDLSLLNEKQLQMLQAEADYYLITDIIGNNDRFDFNIKGPCTMFSDNNKTATASSTNSTAALGVCGISSGKRTWKLRMNYFFDPYYSIMVGVIRSANLKKDSIPNFGLDSNKKKYFASFQSSSTASGDWVIGHIIQIDLDCDNHTLTIKNLNTGKSEMWCNMPVDTYYLHVILSKDNYSVTILDQ